MLGSMTRAHHVGLGGGICEDHQTGQPWLSLAYVRLSNCPSIGPMTDALIYSLFTMSCVTAVVLARPPRSGLTQRRARRRAEQAVRLAQPVRLVRDGHDGLFGAAAPGGRLASPALSPQRNLARHDGDAPAGRRADALDGFGHLAVAVGRVVR